MNTSQSDLRQQVLDTHHYWEAGQDALLRLDPGFLRAWHQLACVPLRKNHLEDKVKAMVALSASLASTHIYQPGIRRHIDVALKYGATREELVEILELTSTLGIHAANIGVPLLLEVLEEEGLRQEPSALTERQEALKASFVANRGYWHASWDGLLELDPDLFEYYIEFSSVPWRSGVLSPKVKELIYCAFDASATHLYEQGLKLHMRNAIGYGATKEEILEVLEIVSLIGMHGVEAAAPLLEQALNQR
ncbi:carboxymuconolactone decarboxylase family protein [Pluralibacter gergoviae]|uniref:Carboxymuconolactone decarboxylase family protein n=1 Tax=Pluralibacter gergoviae TaxID=61647 RepID=A0AAI9DI69_PLUGE|nr:carboxymuconolactone decarboxylase family protein [Pluralibacter gergoviae]EKV0913892.1 carboxymuconolactone decarboxylase family protein [Pluralibacter gergoviae]EKV9906724.1 carboxymuconolactone decarboxylase family protein [Pluralibacter gergoviae]EKW7272231.1 carboxymuconolactone decarboxylase family protein [Pluralibacter gergoviae]ELD4294666.1 carboxymuconolactone decarboxylase family protein [Pluralibacter gergoviae]ELD4305445.1 carboxymuconolactone decarboxylase family protein [Plur